MALFSFGKKDKNPPEVAAPVAKTQPTPPKIQNPPGSGSFPAVKPPQPTGLMPAAMPAGTATTQPMVMPRTGATGLKAVRPGPPAAQTRSTQRIVLPTPPGARNVGGTKPLGLGPATGRINLPIGMILRCLPPEVLADDLSKFEANGTAATEIGLPMNMILGQLPSGKVEMTLQDLIPHFPAGYLQPTDSIASYLPNLVSLPLMDVVMRIPPDLLALRPDQKDVDAAVINMADPFTEEILREQAEAARRQSQTNIIDESQAPQEEFVPRDQAGTAKSIVPPRRPAAEPMVPTRAGSTSALAPPSMPPVAKVPTPPGVSGLRPNAPVPPPPSIPVPAARSASQSGSMPSPIRSTTVLPSRPQAPVTMQFDAPTVISAAPVPPVPRNTGAIPAPPPPKHTTSVQISRRTGTIATLPSAPNFVPPPTAPAPTAETPAPAEQPPVVAGAPDPGADDLQRLAALAMAQLGDSTESQSLESTPEQETESSAPEAAAEEPEPAAAVHAPLEPIRAPAPEIPSSPASSPTVDSQPAPTPEEEASAASGAMAFNLNTCTAEDLVKNIPDCSRDLAEAIVEYRNKSGTFKKLEELLDVPGITRAAYTNLTGEAPPENRMMLTLNELLGFPADQNVTLKDVTDRIACWPDVTGCVLSQSTGLSLVGTVPAGVNQEAVVAFAPRMFEAINKSFSEVSGQETDALVIPSAGTSFHLFRNRNLYLIIMSRLPQMPERHVKVARFVLAALGMRRD
jgi:competence ComEA-like helix-hairpin-helix protein